MDYIFREITLIALIVLEIPCYVNANGLTDDAKSEVSKAKPPEGGMLKLAEIHRLRCA